MRILQQQCVRINKFHARVHSIKSNPATTLCKCQRFYRLTYADTLKKLIILCINQLRGVRETGVSATIGLRSTITNTNLTAGVHMVINNILQHCLYMDNDEGQNPGANTGLR